MMDDVMYGCEVESSSYEAGRRDERDKNLELINSLICEFQGNEEGSLRDGLAKAWQKIRDSQVDKDCLEYVVGYVDALEHIQDYLFKNHDLCSKDGHLYQYINVMIQNNRASKNPYAEPWAHDVSKPIQGSLCDDFLESTAKQMKQIGLNEISFDPNRNCFIFVWEGMNKEEVMEQTFKKALPKDYARKVVQGKVVHHAC